MGRAAMSGTRMPRPDEAGALLVKLKYIRQEKDGRNYVRRKGFPSIRLREAPGTDAFMAEYARALESTGEPKKPPLKAAKESLTWLCQQYLRSDPYRAMAPSSKIVRRRTLEAICAKHGHKRFALMAERHVRSIRDEKEGKPEAANTVLKALRSVFKWSVDEGEASYNPAKGVPKVKYKSDGHHTWTEEEVAQYEARWVPGTRQRLALCLLLYTGTRRSDVVRIGRQMVSGGFITFKTVKNATEVVLPVLPELQAEIDRAPKDNMSFLVTAYGKPFTPAGFGMRFREWCDAAGLPHCTAHGLRKVAASRAAEQGASEKQMNAIFGWGDESNEARRYTKAAGRKRLALSAASMLSVPRNEPGTESAKRLSKINVEK